MLGAGPAAALCAYTIVKCAAPFRRNGTQFCFQSHLPGAHGGAPLCAGRRRGATRSRPSSPSPSCTEARAGEEGEHTTHQAPLLKRAPVPSPSRAALPVRRLDDLRPGVGRQEPQPGALPAARPLRRRASSPRDRPAAALPRANARFSRSDMVQVTSNPLYLWVYLFFMNFVWVRAPSHPSSRAPAAGSSVPAASE